MEMLLKTNIQGTVYLNVVVGFTGEIRDAKILCGVHADLDKEALKIVRSMPLESGYVERSTYFGALQSSN